MAEYIERESAIEALRQSWPNTSVMEDNIRRIPAADVAPVVHGEWVPDEERSRGCMEKIYVCSACHNCEAWGEEERTRFCPWCGAKMRNGFFPHDEDTAEEGE